MNWISILKCVVLVICFQITLTLSAQRKAWFSIETNVVNPLMKGYNFNLFLKPSFTNKFRIGVGTYGLQTPTVVIHVVSCKENVNVDFTKRNIIISNAFNLQLEYFPRGVEKKWFIGEQLSFITYRMNNGSEAWSGKLNTNSFFNYTGFIHRIGESRFYIKPWVGIGFFKVTSKYNVSSASRELNKVSYVMVGVNLSMHL